MLSGHRGHVGGHDEGGNEQEDFGSCGPDGPGHYVGTKQI